MMAPLREKFAQEAVFEAGKLLDGKELLNAVVATASGFARRLLKHASERELLRAKCEAEWDGVWSASYREQVVVENLAWAADAVEKAICMTDMEARDAELGGAEVLLQRPASSDSPFLCAAAHLYLALIWRIRENDLQVALHLLDVFIESPGGGRNELGALLWEQLFQARFALLDAWYHKEVGAVVNQSKPIKNPGVWSRPSSFEALYTDIKGFWRQLPPSSNRSGPLGRLFFEREERFEVLGKLYQEALDENTRRLAEFYKEALSSSSSSKRLHLPSVKLPQVHIQIVQRQLLSRNSLGTDSPASQLSRSSTMKENVCPQETSSRRTPKWLRKKTPNCSLLDGTELDEIKLLSTWRKPRHSTDSRKYGGDDPEIGNNEEHQVSRMKKQNEHQVSDGEQEKQVISASPRTLKPAGYSSNNHGFQKLPPVSALKPMTLNQVLSSENEPFSSNEKVPIAGSLRSKYQVSPDPSAAKQVAELRQTVARLCESDDLRNCERAVTAITRIWMKSRGNPRVEAFLTRASVIDVLMEIMSISVSEEVQRAAVCLVTDLVHRNNDVKVAIKSYDPGLNWFRNVLHIPQAVVLLYLLKVDPQQVADLEIVPILVDVLRRDGADDFSSCVLRAPKAAATFLLEQLVTTFDGEFIEQILSEDALPSLVACLDSETVEEQRSAMVILSCCRKAQLEKL